MIRGTALVIAPKGEERELQTAQLLLLHSYCHSAAPLGVTTEVCLQLP